MSTWVLRVDGVDVTAGVVFADAEFTSAVNGRAGTCHFRVKDANQTQFFTVGKEITLDVDGFRSWGGYVMQIKRGFWFDSFDCRCKVHLVPRYWEVNGADYNILFERRVLYDKITPANGYLTSFPAGTADNTVIDYYIANHLDLSGDGLGTSLVQHVGTPSTDTVIQAGAGWTWSSFMRWITSVTGAIYYIRPDKEVVHADVETVDAPFGISDDPIAGEVGCRDLEIDYNGSQLVNDALVWGAGQGSSSPVFSRSTDTTSITAHNRWQLGAPFQSIYKQTTADSVSSTYVYGSPQSLRGGKDDQISARCAVYTAGLVCGQKVPLRSAVFGFTKTIPIRMLKITFPTKTDVKWDLTLSHEIDQPWTGFDVFPFPPFPPFPPFDPFLPVFPPHNPCISTVPSGPCWEELFSTSPYSPGWVGWSLTNQSGGGDNPSVQGIGFLFDRGTETAGPSSVIDTGSSLSTVTCLDATETSIYFQWSTDGEIANNLDLTAHSGTDYFGPQAISGPVFGERATSFTISGWSGGGSFSPLVTWASDENGTGYMFLRKHGTAYYFAPYIFVFSPDTTYAVRIVQDASGSYVRVRQWDLQAVEPTDWNLEDVTLSGAYALTGALTFSSARHLDQSTTGNALQIYILYAAVSGSAGFSFWDRFNRTTSLDRNDSHSAPGGSPAGWGVSDSGTQWLYHRPVQSSFYPRSGARVDGFTGELNIVAADYFWAQWAEAEHPAIYQDQIVYTGKFQVDTDLPELLGDTQPQYIRAIEVFWKFFGGGESGPTVTLEWDWRVNNGDSFSILTLNDLGNGPDGYQAVYWPDQSRFEIPFLHTNVSYQFRWERSVSGNYSRFAYWEDGFPFSGTWLVRDEIHDYRQDAFPSAFLIGHDNWADESIGDADAALITLRVDDITIACGPDNPPAFEPPIGATCENLQRIATPIGVDPALTYFQTANVYQPGSTKVWVDGLRLAWYDYDELPSQGLIVTHGDVNVGGSDSFVPLKDVYVCYIGG